MVTMLKLFHLNFFSSSVLYIIYFIYNLLHIVYLNYLFFHIINILLFKLSNILYHK